MTDMEDLGNSGRIRVNHRKSRGLERLIAFVGAPGYQPMRPRDLAKKLGYQSKDQAIFKENLRKAAADGHVVRTHNGRVTTPRAMKLISGIFEGNAKGFGFVRTNEGDIFIPAKDVNCAVHGDGVLCKITEKATPNFVGKVVKIIAASDKPVVGFYEKMRSHGRLIPDDPRFPILTVYDTDSLDAEPGQKVVAAIGRRVDEESRQGVIREILGNFGDIGLDVLAIVAKHSIPHVFSEALLQKAESLPEAVYEADLIGRRDFRALPTVTIDGADTKDIDDAVSVERLENGHKRLYVHIADVAHYVRPATPLWKEAARRGTSVYLADRVIPMLPKRLSNGICSLNPSVDRLTLSCIMEINLDGTIISQEICQSVIHSDHSVTYEDLSDMLSNPGSENRQKYPCFLPIFEDMEVLAQKLRARRIKLGALEFDFPECKLIVDENGRVTEIRRRERNAATSIVEEFMIAANEVVSAHFYQLKLPFIYRIHEEPERAKIEALMSFIKNFGHSLRGGKVAKALQNLLARAEGTPAAMIISKQVLRSLNQARYSPSPLGHFGLAKAFYSHFTSPIRRFPDLMIHSIIKAHLAGELDDAQIEALRANLPEICRIASEAERRADLCQHEVEQMKKVEFMMDKVGLAFDGVISHVVSRGMYVELENTVEGFVAADSLADDYYAFEEGMSALVGRRRRKSYAIGDFVRVLIVKADVELRRLDFELVK